jgi:hypothetical protein
MSEKTSNPVKCAQQKSPKFILGLLFVFILFFFGCVSPIAQWAISRDWVARPCIIIDSWADGHNFKVAYRYQVDGRQYIGNKYSIYFDHSKQRSAELERLVMEYQPGTRITCYVNPHNPTQAVLHRSWELWRFMILILLTWSIGAYMYEITARLKAASKKVC